MEFLLLWLDDLDDALGALRHFAPKILGLLLALALFAATGFALSRIPHATLAVAAVLSVTLFESVRRRRTSRLRATE